AAAVAIPHEYADLRAADPPLASAWREASAAAIEACLGAGMVAAGFDAAGARYAFVAREDLPA
ncbi:MAG TPA: GNAT family N-acetyltransferase, partial [Actinomycetota bacterium]|nr:GNAT family N-acetyltransferase [Actinomycetota bacterium]